MVRPIDQAHAILSVEEVAVRVGRKVLVEVDNNCALVVGDQGVILGH
jgi:hypothetical protein